MSLLNSGKLSELGTTFRYMQRLFHLSSKSIQYSFTLLHPDLSGCILGNFPRFLFHLLILSLALSNLFNGRTGLLISLTMFFIDKVYIWFFLMSMYVLLNLLWFYNFLSFVMRVISSFIPLSKLSAL